MKIYQFFSVFCTILSAQYAIGAAAENISATPEADRQNLRTILDPLLVESGELTDIVASYVDFDKQYRESLLNLGQRQLREAKTWPYHDEKRKELFAAADKTLHTLLNLDPNATSNEPYAYRETFMADFLLANYYCANLKHPTLLTICAFKYKTIRKKISEEWTEEAAMVEAKLKSIQAQLPS